MPSEPSPLHRSLCSQLLSLTHPLANPCPPLPAPELLLFKTQPCPSPSAPQHSDSHHPLEHPYYFNCQYYHSEVDRRRPPLQDGLQLYRGVYIGEGMGDEYCANWVQWLYHPGRYKTEQCGVPSCMKKYCPKVHPGEEPRVSKEQSAQVGDDSGLEAILGEMEKLGQLESVGLCEEGQLQDRLRAVEKGMLGYLGRLNQYEADQAAKVAEISNQIRFLASKTSKEAELNARPAQEKPKEKDQDDFDVLFFNEQLKIIEDRQHQFKMFREKDPRRIATLVLEYISAFLNSSGGSIYLGINDESMVHGIEVDQKWIDLFKVALDNEGRANMNPPLMPQKYDVRIIPVKHAKRKDLKVIQIKVPCQPERQLKILTLYKKQCYLRMNASNQRLSAADIMQYMRMVGNRKFRQSIEQTEQAIDHMQYSQLKQLQEYVGKLSSKISSTLRSRGKEEGDDC